MIGFLLVAAVGCGSEPTGGEDAAAGYDAGTGDVTADDSAVDGGESTDATDAVESNDATDAGESDDTADGRARCEVRVDGACVCDYRGKSEGVCADQRRGSAGRCEEPDAYEPLEESCTDGLDNDCDGETDEACECTYDPTESDSVDTDGSHAHGTCVGQTHAPSGGCREPADFEQQTDEESSCGDAVDNDCDGTVDEGCGCVYDPNESRSTDMDGTHRDGVCVGQSRGTDGDCEEPSTFESRTDSESDCDGMDNDCDGAIDEGCTCVYDPTERADSDTDGSHGDGVCTGQTRDAFGVCGTPLSFESRTDSENSCGSDDNDCDGAIDEGCTCTYDPTETDNIDTDNSHEFGVCTGQDRDPSGVCTAPSSFESRTDTESSCDGTDNDCDGYVDEGCSCIYDPGETDNVDTDGTHATGVCPGQTRSATGVCGKPTDYESPEATSCDDGLDNDCDGSTDESAGVKDAGDSCQVKCQCAGGLDCIAGTCVHQVFVTSNSYHGDFGGLSGADLKCNKLASSAGLGGTWRAILSSSSGAARFRLAVDGPVYNRNGDKVADGASDLWDGNIDTAVEYDENGNSRSTPVWTGTAASGTGSGSNCKSWSDSSSVSSGTVGQSSRSTQEWVEYLSTTCDNQLPLYCISGQ